MLLLKAFHIIAMVAWFAGLFYLPRLFVYHTQTNDTTTKELFMIMEKKLYYFIMWPAAILTTVLGIWLLIFQWTYYLHQYWMHMKLALVGLLWIYHLRCGYHLKQLMAGINTCNTRYFRIFNEIPTLLLIGIVLLVIVKPS